MWLPGDEDELLEALEDGRLDEGHHLDFKRELTSGKGANKELARDLAMFANDGGVLIFGVAEKDTGRFEPSPVALDGLRERIDQVARSRLDPPLRVEVEVIPADVDPAKGYVVVRVPASASAPHMSDERYWGRAGTTREPLSDMQVRIVLESRRATLVEVEKLLADEVARDPILPNIRQHGHLYVVARPRYARHDLVYADVVRRSAGRWSTWIRKELLTGQFHPPTGSRWAPDLASHAGEVGDRARGAGLYAHLMGQDRSATELLDDPEKQARRETGLLDLEIDEDGTLHLYCGRGTDIHRGVRVVLPALVAGLCLRVVQVAVRITELTGCAGTWDFGVALTGVAGTHAYSTSIKAYSPTYSADEYRKVTAADSVAVAADPYVVTERLVGQLLRGFGRTAPVEEILVAS